MDASQHSHLNFCLKVLKDGTFLVFFFGIRLLICCPLCVIVVVPFLTVFLESFGFFCFFHLTFLIYRKKNCCSHWVLNEVLILAYDLRNYSGPLSRTSKSENNGEIDNRTHMQELLLIRKILLIWETALKWPFYIGIWCEHQTLINCQE